MTTALHRTMRSNTPQTQKARADQIKNSAGGYVFKLSQADALDRFLILGTEGGTYYSSEKELSQRGMQLVHSCAARMSPAQFMERVVHAANNAPKRTYALYALAVGLSAPSMELKNAARKSITKCVFTGTDFFELVSYIEALRGWGVSARRALNEILLGEDVERLGLWAVKYRERHGWTWRDALRIAHPKRSEDDTRRGALFDVMLGKPATTGILVVDGWQEVRSLTKPNDIVAAIQKYGLPWEALTDEQRTDDVWKACLPFIGDQAVLRNLATFTRRGLDKDRAFRDQVVERLNTAKRLHPIALLNALKTYSSGGVVGRSKAGAYTPVTAWYNALEDALERSFTAGVTPLGQRVLVALDVSGSMGSPVAGSAVLTCREVAAAIGLAFAKTEPDCDVFGFTSSTGRPSTSISALTNLQIGRSSFKDAVKLTSGLPFGGTDCSLPVRAALAGKVGVDLFVVVTDNETWAGPAHVHTALKQYRQQMQIPAKMAVVGLTATNSSIADPTDPGMMDFVGFSLDLPRAIETFARM